MKCKFCVTAYAYKEIEIEAKDEDEMMDKINEEMYNIEFATEDISDYDRDWYLLD